MVNFCIIVGCDSKAEETVVISWEKRKVQLGLCKEHHEFVSCLKPEHFRLYDNTNKPMKKGK